jgi:3-oxoacyl-[acyl-carrier protein] reductase
MDLRLADKTALITSASKGIGKGVAKALAEEGCSVVITSSNGENLALAATEIKELTNADVDTYLMDASDSNLVEKACDEILSTHPKIDILVTNAPGPQTGPAAEVSVDQLKIAIQTNTTSVIQLCRRFIPPMRDNKFGRIINIGSSTGLEPDPNMALSNLTRAAILAYAKTLSREVAKDGITVNTILTGGVLSERTVSLLENDAKAAGKEMDTFLKEIGEQVFPVGYIATPEQFVPMISFLASPLSQYITGVSLPIDGGLMKAL